MVRNVNVPFAAAQNRNAGWFEVGNADGFPSVVAHCGYNLKVPALIAGLDPEEAELQSIIVAGWKSFASTIDVTEFVRKTPASMMRSACSTLPMMSLVDTVAMDCRRMGLSPPIGVSPTFVSDDRRR